MENLYIIVLKNKHLIFSNKKPIKRGNYTKEVKLFKTKESTSCKAITDWASNEFTDKRFNEIINWE